MPESQRFCMKCMTGKDFEAIVNKLFVLCKCCSTQNDIPAILLIVEQRVFDILKMISKRKLELYRMEKQAIKQSILMLNRCEIPRFTCDEIIQNRVAYFELNNLQKEILEVFSKSDILV